jgi:ribonuclease G
MKRPNYSMGFAVASVNEVLIEVRSGRLRAALIIDGRMVQMIVEDENDPSLVGNIYLGRVEKVIDPLNACFVNLGLGRSGFLAMPEVRPVEDKTTPGDKISKYLCEGDKVCVQILRDSFEGKGPKLTTRLTLISRSVILTPGNTAIRISHRIDSIETRSRLKNLLTEISGQKEGFIVRTAAEGVPNEDIIAHVEILREEYLAIKNGLAGNTPTLLHGLADGVARTLRDWTPNDVNKIIIDDTQAYLKAKKILEQQSPALLKRLSHHKGSQPLFAVGNLADDIEQALGERVTLPSGGSIIISETAALVAIDVNVAGTSKGEYERTILETNLEACAEIARQIRLRNLSGLLVVDFVSMKNRKGMNKILAALKQHVGDDPDQVFVAGFTRFGLVEMTRKRSRPSLRTSLGQNCLKCEGSGLSLSVRTHGFNALDRLRVEGLSCPSQSLELRASKAVAECFEKQLNIALSELQVELGVKITIRVDAALEDGFFDVIHHVSSKGETHD